MISGWTDDYYNPLSVDMGGWYWVGNWDNDGTATWYPGAINNYIDIDNSGAGDKFSTSPYAGNGKHGHVGNYYNWPAAIASNDSSNYNASTYADITGNPQNSICPFGWRLPTISSDGNTEGSTNEFDRLTTLYRNSGTTARYDFELTAYPLWFVRGGTVRYNYSRRLSLLDNSGHYAYYWSSTLYDSAHAYHLAFYSSGGGSWYNNYSNYQGTSVRCVAR